MPARKFGVTLRRRVQRFYGPGVGRNSTLSFEPPPVSGKDEWQRWMMALGRDFRRVREFLGFSQEELAGHSGVSQGAVSRLESGRGLHTPFSVIVRINVVLAAALRQLDDAALTEDVRGFLRFMEYLAPPRFRGQLPDSAPAVRVSADEALERVVRSYRALPKAQRDLFVSVMEAAVKTLEA